MLSGGWAWAPARREPTDDVASQRAWMVTLRRTRKPLDRLATLFFVARHAVILNDPADNLDALDAAWSKP